MKTTRIASLFAATLSLIFAASASAAPTGKRLGPSASSKSSTVSSHVEHKAMKRVGPIGKGSVCNR